MLFFVTKQNGHQIIHMKSDLWCFYYSVSIKYGLKMQLNKVLKSLKKVLNLAQQGLEKS